jgi:hypothetical protein
MTNKTICDVCGKEIQKDEEYYVLRREWSIDKPKRRGQWDLCDMGCLEVKVSQLKQAET